MGIEARFSPDMRCCREIKITSWSPNSISYCLPDVVFLFVCFCFFLKASSSRPRTSRDQELLEAKNSFDISVNSFSWSPFHRSLPLPHEINCKWRWKYMYISLWSLFVSESMHSSSCMSNARVNCHLFSFSSHVMAKTASRIQRLFEYTDNWEMKTEDNDRTYVKEKTRNKRQSNNDNENPSLRKNDDRHSSSMPGKTFEFYARPDIRVLCQARHSSSMPGKTECVMSSSENKRNVSSWERQEHRREEYVHSMSVCQL